MASREISTGMKVTDKPSNKDLNQKLRDGLGRKLIWDREIRSITLNIKKDNNGNDVYVWEYVYRK